ncbi:dihydropteroate synthase [Nitrospira moscoviensis]|uniref:Dihydropteroate synthase n=1 Tax=Nitrospira moscoviensis TaxID=42253 RepID=A0A0K2GB58_NITMO|nr:dihydropteroate synthase [Nitrospira moscoviensis]ALA58201.1 7,8-dihydropteroate synthase [Nitrospira moscoviensis]
MEQSLSQPVSSAWFLATGRVIDCAERPLIMGIVNVTPDSFYDGGRYADPGAAVAHAVALVEQGADILDIGAESTRPGAAPISEQEEIDRLIPVVSAAARRVRLPISVDTTKARVAELAIAAGASIINDVSALRFDPGMAGVIARSDAAVVLMHMQGTPRTMQQAPHYSDVVGEIREFFRERMQVAEQAGISESRIVLDPGIGFGKLLVHNLDILAHLSSFAMLNRPLLIGVSRKGFIGQLVDRPAAEREWGTAAAVALAVDRGVQILRVHDVAMMADVVKVACAMRRRAATRQEHYA